MSRITRRPCVTVCLSFLGVVFAGMASSAQGEIAAECRQAHAWVAGAFGWQTQDVKTVAPGLELRRQDYGEFRLRQSALDTTLQLGDKQYERGLGTHSISEIVVRLPKPGERFTAEIGVDNNYDTAGQCGTVIFVVEVAEKPVFRSEVRRSSDPPLPIDIDLGGAKQFVLRVFDADDGPGWDQADWADAAVKLADGRKLWLDELPVQDGEVGPTAARPFSFVYGGKPSNDLLPAWKTTFRSGQSGPGCSRHVATFADPKTGLEVSSEVTLYEDSPAVEWVMYLHNKGPDETPLLESILPLDMQINMPAGRDVTLHHARGSRCEATDFAPIDTPIQDNETVELAPIGGRSSDGQLPFFNLAWQSGGMAAAIGWSGQWAASLQRDTQGGLRLQAGQQTTHLVLQPGERIRTPRILLVFWQGKDRFRGHNRLRQLLLARYMPKIDGRLVMPPVTQNTWFTFNAGNGVDEANQLEAIRLMAPLGVESYWLDAGWFEGGWPSGVGSWVPRADVFPRGLKPLGDAAHERDIKFVVWFEPERVHPESRIAKEHPEFVLHAGDGDGLFSLGDPAARQWLTDHLSKCIGESGIDIYRNDFNIDPLRFWQAADVPNRQGIAEIRYVEGLYTMWDELRRRHPGLWIDTCASGGRRIDLEILSRSIPLWRSDTQCCGRAMPIQDQSQMAGLSLYVPLHSAGCWGFDPYEFRSVSLTGTNICLDGRSDEFPTELAKAAIEEVKSLRHLYLGNYYPLLPITLDESQWCGWQFHRADPGSGLATLFRRPDSQYASLDIALQELEPQATYEVSFRETYEVKRECRMTGAELARLRVEIDSAPGSVMIVYQRVSRE